MTKKEFKQNYPFLYLTTGKEHIEFLYTGKDSYYRKKSGTEKKFLSYLKKEEEKLQKLFTAPKAKSITIDINWKKSRIWGWNPHAEGRVWGENGFAGYYKATCSGCGYDKASTVIADILNQCARQMLYNKRRTIKKAPYGIRKESLSYEGGVGVSCYKNITEWLGGTWHENRRCSTYDYFELTFK